MHSSEVIKKRKNSNNNNRAKYIFILGYRIVNYPNLVLLYMENMYARVFYFVEFSVTNKFNAIFVIITFIYLLKLVEMLKIIFVPV